MPYSLYSPSNQLGLQRLASADLRARTINNFKEVSHQHEEIENCAESLKLFLEGKYDRYIEEADHLDNLDDSHKA